MMKVSHISNMDIMTECCMFQKDMYTFIKHITYLAMRSHSDSYSSPKMEKDTPLGNDNNIGTTSYL